MTAHPLDAGPLAGQPEQPPLLVSPVATFWISLVGGPPAALWVGVVNLARARRLRSDAFWLGWVVLLSLAAYGAIFAALARPLLFPDPERAYQLAARAWFLLGALAFGILWWRLRAAWAAQQAAREPWPNPWNLGLAAVFVAWGLRLAASLLLIIPR